MTQGLDSILDRARRLEERAGADAGREFLIDEFTAKGMTAGLAKGLAEDALKGNTMAVKSVVQKAAGDTPWSDISFVHTFSKDIHPGGGQHGSSHPQMVSTQQHEMQGGSKISPTGGPPGEPLNAHSEKKNPGFPLEDAHSPREMVELARNIRKAHSCSCVDEGEECSCSSGCDDCNCADVKKAYEQAQKVEKALEKGCSCSEDTCACDESVEKADLEDVPVNENEGGPEDPFASGGEGEEDISPPPETGQQDVPPGPEPEPSPDLAPEESEALSEAMDLLDQAKRTLSEATGEAAPDTEPAQGGPVRNDRTDPITEEFLSALEGDSPARTVDEAMGEEEERDAEEAGRTEDSGGAREFQAQAREKFDAALQKSRINRTFEEKKTQEQLAKQKEAVDQAFDNTHILKQETGIDAGGSGTDAGADMSDEASLDAGGGDMDMGTDLTLMGPDMAKSDKLFQNVDPNRQRKMQQVGMAQGTQPSIEEMEEDEEVTKGGEAGGLFGRSVRTSGRPF